MTSKDQAPKNGEIAERTATISERFLAGVEREFEAQMGRGVQFSPLEQRLTQHMFLKIDQALKAAEAKRSKGTPFTWANVNLQALALDTAHRVSLGLDALIPNHVHPVMFYNGRNKNYDVLLLVGYVGLDHVVRTFAAEPPLTIRYQLVFDTDHFRALPRATGREIEGYEFDIESPFNRGEIIGGFGYIEYDDPRKNQLVLVTPRDFERARAASKGGFWSNHELEMHYKTIVRRVTSRILLDPEKVNARSLAAALEDDADPNERAAARVALDAAEHANRKTIDLPANGSQDDSGPGGEGTDAADGGAEQGESHEADEPSSDEANPGF